MKAINVDGQNLIDNCKIRSYCNRTYSIGSIKNCLDAIKIDEIESAKEHACEAYELIFDACRDSFIAVDGLVALVINEKSDAENHNKLSHMYEKLYCIYSDLFRLDIPRYLGENIIDYRTFQIYRIIKSLMNIVNALIEFENNTRKQK